jgi:transposase
LAAYAAGADNSLDRLVAQPVAHPAGQVLNKQIKACRTKFFGFLSNREVPATNDISEREIRPSVVFRKITNGFRSDSGARNHVGYRSVTGPPRLRGQPALQAIRDVIGGKSAIA